MAYRYRLLNVRVHDRVATVTLANPPLNLITWALYNELAELSLQLERDRSLAVVIFESDDPDFFLAHFDVEALLAVPVDEEPRREAQLSAYHQLCERFRNMDKVIIGCIEGRVGGGGSELAASFDMRFGVRGQTVINQMEVPLGILPGGSGTQHLPRLVGRGRALEIILGGQDIDAETAERWGYLNRIFEPDEIRPYVRALADRIASFPLEALRLAKQAVNAADGELHEGLAEEAYLFQQLLRSRIAQRNMLRFLENGGQTRAGELRIADLAATLGR